ncbi:MAG: DUF1573 domain-containing protein [Bacteroidota bacterium]
MKKNYISVFFFLLMILFFSCQQGDNNNETTTDIVNIQGSAGEGINKENLPIIKFNEVEFDFDTITQGEKVSHDFKFRNLGKSALVISSASASCGCTVTEYPKKPIRSGESAEVNVVFDSSNKSGIVTKEVTLITNCMPNKTIIRIKANIFVPANNNPVKS